jgi:hypothetical protein
MWLFRNRPADGGRTDCPPPAGQDRAASTCRTSGLLEVSEFRIGASPYAKHPSSSPILTLRISIMTVSRSEVNNFRTRPVWRLTGTDSIHRSTASKE